MKQLKADFDYREYLTVYAYCTVFPIEKTNNGFFKCLLTMKKNRGGSWKVEWVIPAEYLGDGGKVVASKDLFFARWLAKSRPEILKNKDGKEILDKYGQMIVKERLHLGQLIEFWNTRVFGPGSDNSVFSK